MTVFVCFYTYSVHERDHSLPLRTFLTEFEAQEWVKDEAMTADWYLTPHYVEIEIG